MMKWDIDTGDSEPGIYVREITFNDGSTVSDIGRNDIIVFVGANNVGKSQTLRDIYHGLGDEPVSILMDMHAYKSGQARDIVDLVKKVGNHRQQQLSAYYVMDQFIDLDNIEYFMSKQSARHESLRNLFACNLDTEKRLTICSPAPPIGPKDPKTHPIHYVAFDVENRKKFTSYFFKAFHKYIYPNGQHVKDIPLVIADQEIHFEGNEFYDETERNEAYGAELGKYPMAQEEGDGVKGFIGILLYLILDFYKVYLIDEPEAFLHPPQARIMGQMIGELTKGKKQTFISTHSEQLIQGLLETASDRVKIVRVTREGHTNHVSVLNAEKLQQVWKDPILKYSNILEGLFSRNVVLCESDSDCRFYSIINDFLQKENGKYADTFFTYSGGKQRVPVIMKALSALDVDTKVIVDFDVLNNKTIFQSICKACRMDWHIIEKDYQNLYDEINRQPGINMKTKNDIQIGIGQISKRNPNDKYYSDSEIGEIKDLLKGRTYWRILKKAGQNVLPPGQAVQCFNNIDKYAKEHDLFIVPVGELEGFVKTVSGHGPDWVNDVLSQYGDLHDPVYDEAKKFVKELQL